jgi:tetratricopeptide (TPR) repeat protein
VAGAGGSAVSGSRSRDLAWVAALVALAAVVAAVHWPALDARAISFDDEEYAGQNPLVTNPSWDSASRFLSEMLHPSSIPAYYHPLPMISLMLDRAAGGRMDRVRPFRITSLVFHVGTTILVTGWIYLLFGSLGPALGAGLLFGVHPLTVEEVVWLAQRKAVMAAFFSVAALLLHVWFVRSRRPACYAGSLVAFVLALMSKPSSTPLPILLVLLDFWPLRRASLDTLREKIPFFVVGGVGAAILAYSHRATNFLEAPQISQTTELVALVFYKLAFYAEKIVWPHALSGFYPAPQHLSFAEPRVLAGAFGALGLASICVLTMRKSLALPVGLAFFLICLFPALGVFHFSWIFAQDNYIYLPMIGLFLPLAALLTHFWSRAALPGRALLTVLVLSVASAEAVVTRDYLAQWSDSLTLHRHMIAVAPESPQLRYNYGYLLNDLGRAQEAEQEFRTVIALDPDYPRARYALAILLFHSGRFAEAAEHLEVSARLTPDNAGVHRLLGHALLSLDRLDDAVSAYQRAIALSPDDVETRVNLSTALARLGRPLVAAQQLERALQSNDRDAELFYRLGQDWERADRPDEAVAAYRRALAIDPRHRAAEARLAELAPKSDVESADPR